MIGQMAAASSFCGMGLSSPLIVLAPHSATCPIRTFPCRHDEGGKGKIAARAELPLRSGSIPLPDRLAVLAFARRDFEPYTLPIGSSCVGRFLRFPSVTSRRMAFWPSASASLLVAKDATDSSKAVPLSKIFHPKRSSSWGCSAGAAVAHFPDYRGAGYVAFINSSQM